MSQSTRTQSILGPLLAWMPELRNRHFLVADILALCLTPAMALMLRLDGPSRFADFLSALSIYTLLTLVARVVVFYRFGLYGRYWRYATVDELAHIVQAVLTSSLLIGVVFYGLSAFWKGDNFLPRSLPIMDGLLVLAV